MQTEALDFREKAAPIDIGGSLIFAANSFFFLFGPVLTKFRKPYEEGKNRARGRGISTPPIELPF